VSTIIVAIGILLIAGAINTDVEAIPPAENSLHFEWASNFPDTGADFIPPDVFVQGPSPFPLFDSTTMFGQDAPPEGFFDVCHPNFLECRIFLSNFIDDLERKFLRIQVSYNDGPPPFETFMVPDPDSPAECFLQSRVDEPGYYYEDWECRPNPIFEIYRIQHLEVEITQIVIDTISFDGDQPPSESVLLIIDEDGIDNGNPPNFFDGEDVNEDDADVGVRTQIPFFANNIGSAITLHTGEVGDEGWFALKTIPKKWSKKGPTDDGLRNFILAGPGLGSGSHPEKRLDKIRDVTPLRASGLKLLEGENVCAVVYDGDISINYKPLDGSLKGANLGIVAFKVSSVTQLTGFSSSSLPEVEIEILDAEEVCEDPLKLFTDAPEPDSSSEPFDVIP